MNQQINPTYTALELKRRCLNEEIQFHEPNSWKYNQLLIDLEHVNQQLLETTPFL